MASVFCSHVEKHIKNESATCVSLYTRAHTNSSTSHLKRKKNKDAKKTGAWSSTF
jgi:hypothetical protein